MKSTSRPPHKGAASRAAGAAFALGGTTYAAATLPRNSVGNAQLRSNRVTASKIRSNSVGSSEIRDRSVGLRDISTSARNSLRGSQGPAGPAGPAGPGTGDRAAVTLGGLKVAGNARGASHSMGNEYTVEFTHDVSGCIYSATLAAVNNGTSVEQPPAGGRATVASAGGPNVLVKTYDGAGAATEARPPHGFLLSERRGAKRNRGLRTTSSN